MAKIMLLAFCDKFQMIQTWHLINNCFDVWKFQYEIFWSHTIILAIVLISVDRLIDNEDDNFKFCLLNLAESKPYHDFFFRNIFWTN